MTDKAVVTQTTLDEIGQAIIAKGGATAAMTPAQMPAAIQAIPSGGGKRGDYYTDDGEWIPPEDWPKIDEIARTIAEKNNYQKYVAVLFGVDNDNSFSFYSRAGNASLIFFSDNPDVGVQNSSAVNHQFDTSKDISVSSYFAKMRWVVWIGNSLSPINLFWDIKNEKHNKTIIVNYSGNSSTIERTTFKGYGLFNTSSSTDCTLLKDTSFEFDQNSKLYLKRTRACPVISDNLSNMFSRGLGSDAFYDSLSIIKIPDYIDLTGYDSSINFWMYLKSLLYVPKNIRCNHSLNLSSCESISCGCSIADFQLVNGAEEIVDGMVKNINECPNSGQTISFNNRTKELFTADQWTAIKTALAAKNWGCSPA